jgi:type I restriction enzyme M protein
MSAEANRIVNKLWSYCNVLRDDGLSYGDYLEQLTYLLFLKMADEQTKAPVEAAVARARGLRLAEPHLARRRGAGAALPGCCWSTWASSTGCSGLVFRKAQNKIQDPAKLKRLVSDLIDKEQWVMVDADIKGDAYEGLLERNAQDTKSGAGQYFTPRPLIDAMVAVVAPMPGETIVDPACGTGGFLLAAHHWLTTQHPEPHARAARAPAPRRAARRGDRAGVTRLCAMNLLLHNVGPTPQELDELRRRADRQGGKDARVADAEIDEPPARAHRRRPARAGQRALRRGAHQPALRPQVEHPRGGRGRRHRPRGITYEREDFWATTTNKQLNFVQHVKSLLKIARARRGGGARQRAVRGRRGRDHPPQAAAECDVHTLLRLPTGIFYAQGVKANVLFFDRKPASPKPWTRKLWVYDLRTNQHFTLKTNPMKRADLDEFVALYKPGRCTAQATWSEATPEGRWRAYDYDELVSRDKCSLDLFWLKDDSLLDADNLPDPDVIAQEIAEDLRVALEQIEEILGDLNASA